MGTESDLPEEEVFPDDREGEGLRLCELPEKSVFEGGGNLYMVLNETHAVQVKYDSEKKALVGYGTEIPFSKFPDVRVHRKNPDQTVVRANTLKRMRQGVWDGVKGFLGSLLEKGAV